MADAITTPPVRVSFPQVFVPKAYKEGDTPKYSVVLMFDKKNREHMDCMKKLAAGAQKDLVDKWPDEKSRPRIPVYGADLSPIKDADTACDKQGIPLVEKNPMYAGHWVIRVSSQNKPPVVDRNMQELLDQAAVYGGCFCKVNINSYAFVGKKNKGVTFGLNGVQKWEDGESFGGSRPPVDQMFEPGGAEDPSNYDDFGAGSENDPF